MPVHWADRLYIGDDLIVGGQCKKVYEFDFKQSVSWWTLQSNLYQDATYWICRSSASSWQNEFAFYEINEDLSNVSKITMECEFWWNTWSWYWSSSCRIYDHYFTDRPSWSSAVFLTSQYSTQRTWSWWHINATLWSWSYMTYEKDKIVLDLANKKWNLWNNSTQIATDVTISDSDINLIKSYDAKYIALTLDARYWKYISSMKLEIEY